MQAMQAVQNDKLPRREREKLRQRQEMLAAALDLFSEKGYHNVSMHEVAGKAEFAIGTLYKFFRAYLCIFFPTSMGQVLQTLMKWRNGNWNHA